MLDFLRLSFINKALSQRINFLENYFSRLGGPRFYHRLLCQKVFSGQMSAHEKELLSKFT
jgi:hypothetical protein